MTAEFAAAQLVIHFRWLPYSFHRHEMDSAYKVPAYRENSLLCTGLNYYNKGFFFVTSIPLENPTVTMINSTNKLQCDLCELHTPRNSYGNNGKFRQ